MTLDQKLHCISHWNKADAIECWTMYEGKYFKKHGGALHRAMMHGNPQEYIERECQVFARYARMWKHYRIDSIKPPMHWGDRDLLQHKLGKPLPPEVISADLHQIAQENKLKRYSHHGHGNMRDVFP